MLRKLSVAFAAGAVGAVANVAFVGIMAQSGALAAIGINIPAPPIPAFLYKQVAWGGLWGLPLVLPFLSRSWFWRGILLGVLASLAAMFIFFPMHTAGGQGPGTAGLNIGPLMPVLVLVANSIWGVVAAYWYKRAV